MLAKLLGLTRVGVGESMCAKKRQTEIKRETGKTRPILRPKGSDTVLISLTQLSQLIYRNQYNNISQENCKHWEIHVEVGVE